MLVSFSFRRLVFSIIITLSCLLGTYATAFSQWDSDPNIDYSDRFDERYKGFLSNEPTIPAATWLSIVGDVPSYTGIYQVTWGAVEGAIIFELQVKSLPDGFWIDIAATSTYQLDVVKTEIEDGSSFQYQVRGCNTIGCSDWTESSVVLVDFHPLDTDGDGIFDYFDDDDDNDGVNDADDAFPLNATESIDSDNDGVGNNADTDDDNDGVNDDIDAFPLNPNETIDTDGDGIGNNADTDDDGDGVTDAQDTSPLDPGFTFEPPKPSFVLIEDVVNLIDHNGIFRVVWPDYYYSQTSFSLWQQKGNGTWTKHTELERGYGWPTVGYVQIPMDQQGLYRYKLQTCANTTCYYGPDSETVTVQSPPPTVSVSVSIVTANVTNPNTGVVNLSMVGTNVTHYNLTEVNADNPAEIKTQTVNHWSPGPVIGGWGNKNSGSSWQYFVEPCYNTTCGTSWSSGVIKVELQDIDEIGLNSSLLIGGVNPVTSSYCIIPKGKTTCHDNAEDSSSYVNVRVILDSQYAAENICLYRNNVELGCQIGDIPQQRTYDTTVAIDTYEVRVKKGTGSTTPILRKRFRGYPAAAGTVIYDNCNILAGQETCSSQIHWTRDNAYVQTCLYAGTPLVETNDPLQCWDAGVTSGSYPIELNFLPKDYYVASSEKQMINATAYQYINAEFLGDISATGLFEGVTLTADPNFCYSYLPETSCRTTITWETTNQAEGCLFKSNGELLFCGKQGHVDVDISGSTDFYLRENSYVNSQVLGSLRTGMIRRATATFTVNDQPCVPAINQTSCNMSVTANYYADRGAHLFKNGVSWGDYGPGIGTNLVMNLEATNKGALYELRESNNPTSHLMAALTLRTANFESNGYGFNFAADTCEVVRGNNTCSIGTDLIAPEQPSGDKVCVYRNGFKLGCHSHDIGLHLNLGLIDGKNIFQLRVETTNELVAQRVLTATRLPYSEIISSADECEIEVGETSCGLNVNWHWDCSINPTSNYQCVSAQEVCLYLDGVTQNICSTQGDNLHWFEGGKSFNFNQEKDYVFELRESINGVESIEPLATKTVNVTKAFAPFAEFTSSQFGCSLQVGETECEFTVSWRSNLSVCATKSTNAYVYDNNPDNLGCSNSNTPQDSEGFYVGSKVISLEESTMVRILAGDSEGRYATELARQELYVGLPQLEITGLTITRPTNNSLQISWPKNSQASLYQLQHFVADNALTPEQQAQIADTSWTMIASIPSTSVTDNVVSFIDENLTQGRHYYYRVRACNGDAQCGI